MPSRPKTRATQRARAHSGLVALVGRCRAEGLQRLPSLRTVARTLNCSYATLCRAATELARESLLDIRPGSGMWLEPQSPHNAGAPALPAPRTPRSLALADSIREGLLLGRFAPHATLPSAKELATTLSSSPRSAALALRALAAEGLVSRRGRRWVPSRALLPRAGGTLVVVSRGFSRGWPVVFANRYQGVIGTMEEQCLRRRVQLEVATYHFVNAQLRPSDQWIDSPQRWKQHRSSPLMGFVLFGNTLEPHLGEIVPRLAAHGVPISIIREQRLADLPLPEELRAAPVPVTLFCPVCDDAAGQSVAQYLLARGHRQVVYLGASADTAWSSRRFRAAARAFDAVAGATLTPLLLPGRPPDSNVRARWRALMDGGYNEALLACALGGGEPVSARLRRRLTDNYLADESLSLLVPLSSLYGFERVAAQALAHRDATAWVCANESIAMLAHDFLRSRRVAVPERISVIGIDDILHTLSRRITMYRFGVQETVHGAVHAILSPSLVRAERGVVAEHIVEGVLIERETTASAQHT